MRYKGLVAGLVAGLMLVSASGFAQTPPPPPPAAKNARPSERALELSRRYFEAMHFAETMDNMLEGMDPILAFGDSASSMSESDKRAMHESMREAMSAIMPRYIEGLTPIFASTFTEEELEAMVAFYESPVGQSVVMKSQSLSPPVTAVMMDLMPDILSDALERFCSKTSCSNEMKKKLGKRVS